MIASDLHGSAYYWRARMLDSAVKPSSPMRLIFLGDILYHGPRNDLPREYAPKQVIAKLHAARRTSSSASAATATARSTRWCCQFPVLADYGFRAGSSGRAAHLSDARPRHQQRRIRCRLPRAIFCYTGTRMCPPARTAAIFRYLNPGSVSIPKEQLAPQLYDL